MKGINILKGLLMMTIMCVLIQSCSNDMKPSAEKGKFYTSSGVILSPDVVIWAGGQVYANTLSSPQSSATRTESPMLTRDGNDKYNVNEVEVHLSVQNVNSLPINSNKAALADLAGLLSVYVRSPQDVEVILPVPEQIYCDQDAMFTLKEQEGFNFRGETIEFTNLIGDNIVNFYVEFVSASEDDLLNPGGVNVEGVGKFGNGYIRIYTKGINADVISYCKDFYEDYLNFKVYTYFNRGHQYTTDSYPVIDKHGLVTYFLSHSLVNFDWQQTDVSLKSYPNCYVNALSVDGNGNLIEDECLVWILGDYKAKENDNGLYSGSRQLLKNGAKVVWNDGNNERLDVERNYFNEGYRGSHFNGSPFNWIYDLKSLN